MNVSAGQRKPWRPWPRAGVAVCLLGTTCAQALPDDSLPNDQSQLQPLVNSGGSELKFDWPLVRVGTAEYKEGPTGVTVFRFGKKVTAAFDVRGEPGTVQTEWLRLGRDKPMVDAVVLSGGSFYGLEASTAVASALKDDQLRTGSWNDVAYVPGAIIYDMGDRRLNEIYPDKRLAQAAFRAAVPGLFRVGAAGAGRMAMTGHFFGADAHSGQGGAFFQRGQLKIACFTVVNALGAVTDRQGRLKAGYPDVSWPSNVDTARLLQAVRETDPPGPVETRPSQNSTISLVVVNQKLAFGDLQRLAIQVHTSMARGLQPFATEWDGDVLFAVSTDEVELPRSERECTRALALIPAIASEVMWDAILSSVPEQPRRPQPVSVTTPLPGKWAGKYRFSRFVTVEISAEGGRLFARAIGERDAFAIHRDRAIELVPVSPALDQFTVVPAPRFPLTLDFSTPSALVLNPGLWAQTGRKLQEQP